MYLLVLILLGGFASVKAELKECPTDSPTAPVFVSDEDRNVIIMRCPGTNLCVYKGHREDEYFCEGKFFCPNQTDAELCRDSEVWRNISCNKASTFLGGRRKRVTEQRFAHDRCDLPRSGGWPGQCVPKHVKTDKEYNCFDRSDSVDPFQAEKTIDFTKMKICNNSNGKGGYMCNRRCKLRKDWCQSTDGTVPTNPDPCVELDGIGVNDPELCGNFSFWSTALQCENGPENYRCEGRYSGQCAQPPGAKPKTFFKGCDNRISKNQCYLDTFDNALLENIVFCDDKSHLVQRKCELFPANTSIEDIKGCTLPESKCKNEKYDHCKNLCEWDDVQKTSESEKLRKKYPGSKDICSYCHEKTICPNLDYFICDEKENATVVAIHKDLVCDQHPQCSNGEDERNCFDEYRKKKFTNPNAKFECQSIHHPNVANVRIQAVRCDGKAECVDAADEAGCNTPFLRTEMLPIFVVIVFLSYFVPFIFSKLFSLKANTNELKMAVKTENDNLFNQIISAKDKKERRNLFKRLKKTHNKDSNLKIYRKAMLSLKMSTMNDEDKNIVYALIYKIEGKIHQQSKKQVHACLMKTQSNVTSEAILNSVYPGCFKVCFDNYYARFIKLKWNEWMEKLIFRKFISIVKRLVKIILFYLDLLKDGFLIFTLLNLIGPDTVFKDLTVFSHQIIFVLLLSVLIPIYCTSIKVATKYPFVLFGYGSYNLRTRTNVGSLKMRSIQVLIVLFAPLVPALLIDLAEKEYDDLRDVCQNNSEDESILNREEFVNLTKKLILDVKKLELCVEVPIQITVLLIMILLEKTKTKTVSGLESVFKTDPVRILDFPEISPEIVLLISIMLSLKTAIFTFMKIKSIEKDSFLTFVGKTILFIRALLVLSARFTSYLLFFTPFLGLGNILAHHWIEKIPFNPPESLLSNETFSYWNDGQVQTVLLKTLYKHIKTVPSSVPSYTDYTGISLTTAYAVFWTLIVGHITLAVIIKSLIYRNDSDSDSIGFLGKVRHSFSTLNLPDMMKDWDMGSLDSTDCEMKWYKIRLEMFFASLLHWISNCLFIAPAIFTGLRIKDHHELLVAAIGVREEEEDSYNTAHLLLWVPALIITIVSILEFCLFLLYNRFGHPWKELLKEDEILPMDEDDLKIHISLFREIA